MKRYRKKPVVVEAMQFTNETKDMCFNFVTWNRSAGFECGKPVLRFETAHRDIVTARIGDWIIKGPQGDFWPCTSNTFEHSYEEVKE